MIGIIDRLIGNFITRKLHEYRDRVINATIALFTERHHPDEQTLADLHNTLNLEIERVYAIADSSIIRARILQARYTFWITAVVATAITVGMATYPISNIVPLFAPLIAAFVVWTVNIVTIPFPYNQRIQGGMDSALVVFEDNLRKRQAHPPVVSPAVELQELRIMVNELRETVTSQDQKINILTSTFFKPAINDIEPVVISNDVYLDL